MSWLMEEHFEVPGHLKGLFEKLGRSKFRSKWRLSERDAGYLKAKGLEKVLVNAAQILRARVGAASPVKDGRQTPYHGHPVFTAQHATGTCCRSCILKWHGIEKGRELREEEIGRLVEVIGVWLGQRTCLPSIESAQSDMFGRRES